MWKSGWCGVLNCCVESWMVMKGSEWCGEVEGVE